MLYNSHILYYRLGIDWGKQLNCKAMRNYLTITPMLIQIYIKIGLRMFYYSQQSSKKLSDELCDQMVTEDIVRIISH